MCKEALEEKCDSTKCTGEVLKISITEEPRVIKVEGKCVEKGCITARDVYGSLGQTRYCHPRDYRHH